MAEYWHALAQLSREGQRKWALMNALIDNYNGHNSRLRDIQERISQVRQSGDDYAVLQERDLLSELDQARRDRDSSLAELRRIINELKGILSELGQPGPMAHFHDDRRAWLRRLEDSLPH